MLQHGLVLQRGLTVAVLSFALSATAFAQAQTRSIAQLVPASTPGAVFVSVENLMSSFGSHFTTGSLAHQLDELVSHGLPDPRKDIRDLGVAFDFTDSSDRNVGVVCQGKVDLKKALDHFRQEGAEISQEPYRGVVFNHIKQKNEKEILRVAAADDQTTIFSAEDNAEAPVSKQFVDTFSTTGSSYGDAHHTELPKGYFVALAFDVPESLRHEAAGNPMTAPLAAVTNISGTLREEENKVVKLDLGLTCDEAGHAAVLKAALENLLAQLIERAQGNPEALAVLKSIKLEQAAALVKLTMELPRKQIEDILVGLNH